jgi:ATP-dependent Clp protease ATP-binding subunit ClpC
MHDKFYDPFTEKAIKSLTYAQDEARHLGQNYCGVEHILLGLLQVKNGSAARALHSADIKLDHTRIELEKLVARDPGDVPAAIPFTRRARRVLELAWDNARKLDNSYVGAEHLLLGLIDEIDECALPGKEQGIVSKLFENIRVDRSALRQTVLNLMDQAATL